MADERAQIDRVHVLDYRMPLKRSFATSRSVVDGSRNVLVRLEVHSSAGTSSGIGEGAPRSPSLTGDTRELSWTLLVEAASRLKGMGLPLGTPQQALGAVDEVMDDLRSLASHHAPPNAHRALRGTLLGLEMALLDAVARARGSQVQHLLGRNRDRVQLSASTISGADSPRRLARRVKAQAKRFPLVRLKGGGNPEDDLRLLIEVHRINSRARAAKPIWIDLNEALDADAAASFIEALTDAQHARHLPSKLILEQPVPKSQTPQLASLQLRADELGRRRLRRKSEILVMADESIWDEGDLDTLWESGGCRAINLKMAKAGGLLPLLRTARLALQRQPETEIYLGSMVGTSDITIWAMRCLALALPRLDYFTLTPPFNVETRIAEPEMRYAGADKRTLMDQEDPGLGTQLLLGRVLPYVQREHHEPEAVSLTSPTAAAPGANTYDQPHLDAFLNIALDSHLLEREFLARGYATRRLSPQAFVADPDPRLAPLAFYWTAGTSTSRAAIAAAGDKRMARELLAAAGVPIPEGRAFRARHATSAAHYAEQLGWPVVVKPVSGHGGTGVVTGIDSRRELTAAIESLGNTSAKAGDFLVESHVPGDDLRFVVVGEATVSVMRRSPASVRGDGSSTIAQLVEAKNRLRRQNPRLRMNLLVLDEAARVHLRRQGFDPSTVPPAGLLVTLSGAANISLGGDSHEVLDEVHPSLMELAVRAARAVVGLEFAGVDLLVEDHRLPLTEQQVHVCEVNTLPSVKGHHFPLFGTPRNVAESLVLHHLGGTGRELREPAQMLEVEINVTGHVTDVGYESWLRRRTRALGLDLDDEDSAHVRARATGPTALVTALAAECMTGPESSFPASVATRVLRRWT